MMHLFRLNELLRHKQKKQVQEYVIPHLMRDPERIAKDYNSGFPPSQE